MKTDISPGEALPRAFFQPSAGTVARKLLGHWLVRRFEGGLCAGLIVETEAYLEGDEACHAFIGETARNRVMWGPPGHGYVYFIYGNHWCFNTVCRPAGRAEAVLIRAIEPVLGTEIMRARRQVKKEADLTNGPGKLCAALEIDRRFDGVDLCDADSPVFIGRNAEAARARTELGPLVTTPRIGITKAAELPLRFCLAGSRFLSRPG